MVNYAYYYSKNFVNEICQEEPYYAQYVEKWTFVSMFVTRLYTKMCPQKIENIKNDETPPHYSDAEIWHN